MQIQRPRKNMNPSFFIPENCSNAIDGKGLSPLSPTPSPLQITANNKTYSPRIYQRQAKIKINSLDFKRNSDHTFKINGTTKDAAEQMAKGEEKIHNTEAVSKLHKGSIIHSSSTSNIFRRANGKTQGQEAASNVPAGTFNRQRYAGHRKVFLDEQGQSPRNGHDLSVITDLSKKSLEVTAEQKQPSTAHKHQRLLRTNSSWKHLDFSKKTPNQMDIGSQEVRLSTKNKKINFNNVRQLNQR